MLSVSENSVVWVDRQGVAQPLPIPPARSSHPAISPDGKRLVWARGPTRERQIWIFDVGPGVSRPLTTKGDVSNAMWSPDEKRLAVAASRDDGPDSMAVLDVDGNAPPRYFGPTRANSPLPADCAIAHRLSRLIWKILHQGVAYEERGPAVAKHRAQRRAAKMIRELRNLGYRVELVPARSVSRV